MVARSSKTLSALARLYERRYFGIVASFRSLLAHDSDTCDLWDWQHTYRCDVEPAWRCWSRIGNSNAPLPQHPIFRQHGVDKAGSQLRRMGRRSAVRASAFLVKVECNVQVLG